jgi:hypothetical protein
MQQTRRALLRLILRVNVLGKIPQCSRFWLAWSWHCGRARQSR